MRVLPSLAGGLALFLAACASETSADLTRTQTAMVGISRAQLLACAGEPGGSTRAGNAEYLVYRAGRTIGSGHMTVVPRIPVIGSLSTGGAGYDAICEATFVIQNDRVAAVTLRTEPPQNAKTAAQLCEPIVDRCAAS